MMNRTCTGVMNNIFKMTCPIPIKFIIIVPMSTGGRHLQKKEPIKNTKSLLPIYNINFQNKMFQIHMC